MPTKCAPSVENRNKQIESIQRRGKDKVGDRWRDREMQIDRQGRNRQIKTDRDS